MIGPQRPTSVIHARPVAVKDAVGQMPKTRGNTGGLSRPINPDNQPLSPPRKAGYGATPEATPLDSKIGWRGQQGLGYDAKKKRHERPNESPKHEAKESPALERREQQTGRELSGYGADKVGKVMHEFKHGELHSGSKHGPKVKSRKQAIAIGMSEARRAKE